ncbi:hypothetical protein L7F22_056572 [Adiantum nelumboides]|nr:hypothetical protein [Adiantum nelumboides]
MAISKLVTFDRSMAGLGDEQVQAGGFASDISFVKVKYGLQNVFASVKMLKDKEASSRQDFQLLLEKHKKLEAAHAEEVLSFRSEITKGNEARCNLEAEVQDLRRDTSWKSTEIQNLKNELKALMDTRSQLTEDLKATNYILEGKLEEKTCEVCVLVEKHNKQSILLEAIEKEAFSVRQVLEETKTCIQQKEEEASSFGKCLMKVLGYEGIFLDRLDELEQQLKTLSKDLAGRNDLVMALEMKLEAASNNHAHETEQEVISFHYQK